jgi:Flp pilus assembly protein TadB
VTLLVAVAVGVAVTALALAAYPSAVGSSLVPPPKRVLSPRALLERWHRYRSRERASAGALGVLASTHAALRSGLPLVPALRLALEDVDPRISEPFDRALRDFDLNAALDIALRAVAADAGDRRPALALEALALVAGEQLPASRAAAVIASVADRLSFEERLLAARARRVCARRSGSSRCSCPRSRCISWRPCPASHRPWRPRSVHVCSYLPQCCSRWRAS